METSNVRLKGLDGLRGLAAMWVVLFHIWGAVQRRETDWVPAFVQAFFEYGFLGVDIFFVLSGFVITYSVIGKPVDRFFVPRFIFRRSVRIDPPYWATIGLAIAFLATKNLLFPEHSETPPGLEEILVHMFYLQDLLGYHAISSVFWTLCLEFQFYLGFAVVTWLLHRQGHLAGQRLSPALIFGALGVMVISPYLRFTENDMPIPGTIIPYLYEFILGIFACQYLVGRVRLFELSVLVLVAGIITLQLKTSVHALVPMVTVVAVVGLSRAWGGLDMLVSSSFQFLGRISYSLYLTHAIVGWTSVSLMVRVAGDLSSPVVTAGIFIAGVAISVVFAYAFYHILEKYFIGLSKKFKM